MTRKNGRNSDGTFAKGNSGKPMGCRHKTTRAVESLMQGEAEALSRRVIELALEGDVAALKICIERIAPRPKDAAIQFELSQPIDASGAANASADILNAVARGQLTPSEGESAIKLVEAHLRICELGELELRLARIEEHIADSARTGR